MELFSITCTTCQKRLMVRDASTIGKLDICPNCGSMVLIEAPPGSRNAPASPAGEVDAEAPRHREEPASGGRQAPDAPAAAPDAATDAADRQPASGVRPVADRADAEPEPAAPAPVTGVALPGQAESTAASVPEPSATATQEPPASSDAPALGEPPQVAAPKPPPLHRETVAPTPPAPSDAGSPASTPIAAPPDRNSAREWLKIGAAALVGVVLAMAVFGFVVSRMSAPEPNDLADSATSPGTSAKSPGPTGTDAPPNVAPTAASPVKTGPVDNGEGPAGKPAGPTPAEKPAPSAVSPEQPPATPDREPRPAKPPTDVAAAKTPPDKPAPQATDAASPARSFSTFAPFMDAAPVATQSPTDAGVAKPAELGPVPVEPAAPAVPRPPLRRIEVAQRLKDDIPSIEFSDTPLIEVAQFLTAFSTIPISFDPDALALVKVTPQTPVTVKLEKTNVDRMLATVLTPLRLGTVVTDGQLLVTRPPSPKGALREHRHSVEDLVGEEPLRLGELTDLIVAMIEPESWEPHGGAGVLRGDMPALMIQQRDTVLFRTLVFCDRLRTARGLPPKSNFPPALSKLETRSARAAPMLAKRVTMNYLQPTLLVRMLDQIRRDTHADVLVDWLAVAELGWSPEAETTATVNDLPLGEALDKILRPMDLVYRILDATTFEVTTPEYLATRREVEFYPVGKLLTPQQSPEQLLTRLNSELELQPAGAAAPIGVLHYDPPSKHLIASLPQPLQRELATRLAQPPAEDR